MSNSVANNFNIGRLNRAKRCCIPFTINGNITANLITATIDQEFIDSSEIFLAVAATGAQDGVLGGPGLSLTQKGSLLDPSVNDVNGKAFAAKLGSDTAGPAIGFIVLDGPSEKQPVSIPLPSDGRNPGYGVPQTVGGATRIFRAEVIMQETTAFGVKVGMAVRADATVTANGNLKVAISLATANLFNVAQIQKGLLKLTWQ